jgi:molybdenum-dependent DNA-binding transcriptional regulator ModE
MLNPWRLRLLSRLDTLGTIRAVAQDANLSASSVSQQLAVLETETRTQLLERTGRRVRLTPAGLVLARRARAILDHMDTVEAELRGLREEPAGLVRLGAFQSAIHSLAVPAVARYPQLDVELLELEPHESIPARSARPPGTGRALRVRRRAMGPRHCPVVHGRADAAPVPRVRLRAEGREPVQQLPHDPATR